MGGLAPPADHPLPAVLEDLEARVAGVEWSVGVGGHPGLGDEGRPTAHQWLIQVRCFFADICTWATEDGSPFVAFAPSAAISTAGPPRQIINAWVDGRFEVLASPALINELRDVLARPRFRRWISTETASEFIAGLQESAVIIDDPPAPAALTPDPGDD